MGKRELPMYNIYRRQTDGTYTYLQCQIIKSCPTSVYSLQYKMYTYKYIYMYTRKTFLDIVLIHIVIVGLFSGWNSGLHHPNSFAMQTMFSFYSFFLVYMRHTISLKGTQHFFVVRYFMLLFMLCFCLVEHVFHPDLDIIMCSKNGQTLYSKCD